MICTGLRQKSIRVAIQCQMKLKLTTYYDSPDENRTPTRYVIRRHGDCNEHNHTMEEVDATKRNQRLKDVAAAEVSKRYKVSHVKNALKVSN